LITKPIKLKQIEFFASFSEIIPLIFCILFYKKLNTIELKVFFIYAIFKAVFILACISSIYLLNSKTLYIIILRFHLMFEYLIVSFFFSLLIRSKVVRYLVLFSSVPFLIYCGLDFYWTDNETFHNTPTLIELLFFIIVIIYFLFEKMRFSFQMPVYQTINFWVAVGLFVYFSGIFFYILLSESYFSQNERVRNELLLIYISVTILKNLILAFAVTVKEPKAESEDYEFNIPLEINLDSFESYTPTNNLN